MIRRHGILSALLTALSLGACDSPADSDEVRPDEVRLSVRLEVDSVVSATKVVTWKAQVVNQRDIGVAGTLVRFSFWLPDSGLAVALDSALTDSQGYAQVQYAAPRYGMLNVKAGIGGEGKADSVIASVRVRETVTITTLFDGPPVELDSLSLEGPQCSSTTYIQSNGNNTYTVQDTAVAAVTKIPRAGGVTGLVGRLVFARLPGTTRIIATGQAGGADTLLVRVSAPVQPGQLLRRMPVNRPVMAGIGPDSVVIARGDSVALTLSTDPFSCDAAMLPANFVVSIQSLDPSLVQVEAAESKRWTPQETGYQTAAGVNARLRGVAAGRTEVVATAPYTAPRRIRVIVK